MSKRNLVISIAVALFIGSCLCIALVTWILILLKDNLNVEDVNYDHQAVIEDHRFQELWVRTGLVTRYNFGDSELVATHGNVFVLGGFENSNFNRVLAISGFSGNKIWEANYKDVSHIATDGSALFVGTRFGKIIKRDPSSGEIIWIQHPSESGGILRLHILDDNVYVHSKPNTFDLFESETGKRIEVEIPKKYGSSIYLIAEDVIYSGNKAIDLETGETLWETPILGAIFETPMLIQNRIYIRTDKQTGIVYAIDRNNGRLVWQTEKNVVSNIAASDEKLYFLVKDGALEEVDLETGEKKSIIRFLPKPFTVAGESGFVNSGYYIAVDQDAQFLYVLLGDSNQLFAIKMDN